MVRIPYPHDRAGYSVVGGLWHSLTAGGTVEVFVDENPNGPAAANTPADVRRIDGTSGALTLDATGTQIDEFLSPTSAPPSLIVSVDGGPPYRVFPRLDQLVGGGTVGALLAANNLDDLDDPATARANLELGSAATASTAAFDPAGAAASVLTVANAAGAAASAAQSTASSAASAASAAQSTANSAVSAAAAAQTTADAAATAASAAQSTANGAAPASRQIIAGTGLTGGGTLAADRTLTVAYGTSNTTAARGDDTRLSDARTPTAHAASHGTGQADELTPAAIGAAPTSRQVIAGTGLTGGGTLAADRTLTVAYGTSSTTAARGDDSRLADARTPTAHAASHATGQTDEITPAAIGAVPTGRQIVAGTGLTGGGTLAADRTLTVAYGTSNTTAARGDDSRLSDARTPTAHASSHGTGQSDELTPAAIGAVPTTRQVLAGTGLTGGGTLSADRTLTVAYGAIAGTAAPGNDRRFASSWPLRFPIVLSSPPSTTTGVANAASVIASSALISAHTAGAFSYLGGPSQRPIGGFPNYNSIFLGTYPNITSPAPTFVDFWLDTADSTGRFEISWKGFGGDVRVAIRQPDGGWGYVSSGATFSHAANGNTYLDLVTLGAAGRYRIRLEFTGGQYFYGIQAAPTDSISAAAKPPKRYLVVGDSFAEPTINNSGTVTANGNGFPSQLAYLTGHDIWSAGSGGTGYLQTNSGLSRPKFRDKLATDIFPYTPDGILWAGGYNDLAGFTASAVGAEALLCYQAATAALPGVEQIVLAPWCPADPAIATPTNLVAVRDALRTSAASAGATFLDLVACPLPAWLAAWSSTLQASVSASATTCSVATVPAYFTSGSGPGTDGWAIVVGTDSNAEIRRVTNITGSGPYTLTVANAFARSHSSGQTVAACGRSYMTGTGRQGATASNGAADRYTSTDAIHPTTAGHQHIASTIASLWAAA